MERVLFACREVHVYQVPQVQLVEGRIRCQEWEGQHLFTGRCRVVVEDDRCFVRLEDRISGELFAESPVEESGPPQHALDSSRYFVLQVKDRETQRKAFLGIGFEQRGDAFDFLAAISDQKRQETNEKEAEESSAPPKDFSLKQGQKIRLSVPGLKKNESISKQSSNITQDKSPDEPLKKNSPQLLEELFPCVVESNNRRQQSENTKGVTTDDKQQPTSLDDLLF
eukprot:jgi/Galph1/4497/GphlegSOOS_G3169.1